MKDQNNQLIQEGLYLDPNYRIWKIQESETGIKALTASNFSAGYQNLTEEKAKKLIRVPSSKLEDNLKRIITILEVK